MISNALAEKLRNTGVADRPWLRAFGKLRGLRNETARIGQIIEASSNRSSLGTGSEAVILDTNGLSALADGDTGLEPLLNKSSEFAIPVIVLGEYRFGIMQSRS